MRALVSIIRAVPLTLDNPSSYFWITGLAILGTTMSVYSYAAIH